MEPFISKENVNRFCSTNEKYLQGEIKKLVVEFPGFDGNSCLGGNFNFQENDSGFAQVMGAQGILTVYVYTGPWNWMRDISVKTVDCIIESIIDKYDLPEDITIVAVGGSMGGLGALMYTAKGRYTVSACATSCPVCDLYALSVAEKFHFFCASVYFAFADRLGSFEEVAKAHSPLYNVSNLPKIPYFMIICDADDVIPCDAHAYPMLEQMQAAGHSVETITGQGKGHCEHTIELLKPFEDFVFRA